MLAHCLFPFGLLCLYVPGNAGGSGGSGSSSSSSIIPVIAGIVGGLLVLIVVVLIIVLRVRKQRKMVIYTGGGAREIHYANPAFNAKEEMARRERTASRIRLHGAAASDPLARQSFTPMAENGRPLSAVAPVEIYASKSPYQSLQQSNAINPYESLEEARQGAARQRLSTASVTSETALLSRASSMDYSPDPVVSAEERRRLPTPEESQPTPYAEFSSGRRATNRKLSSGRPESVPEEPPYTKAEEEAPYTSMKGDDPVAGDNDDDHPYEDGLSKPKQKGDGYVVRNAEAEVGEEDEPEEYVVPQEDAEEEEEVENVPFLGAVSPVAPPVMGEGYERVQSQSAGSYQTPKPTVSMDFDDVASDDDTFTTID